jgi:Nucleotide modification associated domain 2
MMLYSYCLRYDDGAAPNPYWGVCTVVICKPAIRRTAHVGDWVVGLGAVSSPIGDISGQVVYAMRVTSVMSMRQYDDHCQKLLSGKIPDWNNRDFRRRMTSPDPARHAYDAACIMSTIVQLIWAAKTRSCLSTSTTLATNQSRFPLNLTRLFIRHRDTSRVPMLNMLHVS